MLFRARFLGLVVPLMAAVGCMQERGTINRVQPDYLDKNDLVPNQYRALTKLNSTPETLTPQLLAREPVFATQNTLIAKPTTTGFTGLTQYSSVDKVRWQVTEDSLIARQSYEFVKNAPGGAKGIGGNVQTGDVVAAFKITKHFDIRRAYNTTTGEELNVLEENDTDRPWYQRQYMRVDWSQNLVSGYNSIFSYEEIEGPINSEPVPVFVNTPNDPNAPVFEYKGQGDKRSLTYFDVVNQAVLHPETTSMTFSDGTTYSAIPVCWLGEGETDCAPAQVTMRLSFRRIDPNRDYEPASLTEALPDSSGKTHDIPHLNMERFGFFDVMRIGYDTVQNATLDTQRMHLAARHNLWMQHHVPAYGADTGTACNSDLDCSDDGSVICRIEAEPNGASRGMCAARGISHRDDDLPCTTDDECRQYSDTGGVSRTAVCDSGSHTCGDRYVRCEVDTDCAQFGQSTCDLASAYLRADNRGLCLLPFRQRQVRQIPYHESVNYPEYMQPVTEQIVTEWNQAFVAAVTSARRHECEISMAVDPSATDPASNPCNAAAVTGADTDAKFIYVGCHSPVWGTADGPGKHTQEEVDDAHNKGWDLASCGPQGTNARIGDLRYSMIGAITDHDNQGYWGLANISGDPETGEVLAGRGAVWQTITDYYGEMLVEYVKLLTNKLTPDQVVDGGDLVAGMIQLGTGNSPSAQLIDNNIRQRGLSHLAAMVEPITKAKLPNSGWFKSGTLRGPNGKLQQGLDNLLQGRGLGDGTSRGDARMSTLRGTQFETMLMNNQQVRLAATAAPDDGLALPTTLEQASPMRGQSNAQRHFINQMRSRIAAYQCAMEAGFQDDLLLGLARRLAGGAPIMQSDPLDGPVAFGRDWTFKKSDGTYDFDLMGQYARQFIHHGVLAHELGHSVGERHNFTASADAINYHDQFWKVRLQGHPTGLKPRYEYLADTSGMEGKYYSDEEIAGRIDEWSYSSVMDYKGLNEDAHGIGRYDVAFVKNGYVNMVEAFKTVANIDGALMYATNVAGSGFSTPLDLSEWPGKIHGMHYTQIPSFFGTKPDGTPNIGDDNRFDVFLHETGSQQVNGWGAPSVSNTTNDGHVLVPYRFDSDERAGLVWQDQRYDAGPDQFESLHYVTSHLLDYYFINSYARLRSGFSTKKYVARIWGRYLDQLRQTTQLQNFDLQWWQNFFSDTPNFNAYMTDPKEFGGYVNLQAMSESADTIFAILTMPEIGGHSPSKQFDDSNLVIQDFFTAGQMQVAVNDGRAFESDWRNDAGFFWYDMLDRAGAYYDKVMMLQALTDPDLYLLQRDTPTDIRLFQLSYYTMFPGQMIRLFGGLMAEDYNDYAPTAVGSGSAMKIVRPHVVTANTDVRTIDATHQPLDPQTHYTVQLWTAVTAMAEFPATYDQRYMEFSRVWLDGSNEQINVPIAKQVKFSDPFSGQTYVALHYDCTKADEAADVGCSTTAHASLNGLTSNEAGVGARMLLHLQDMEAVRQKAIAANDTAKAQSVEQQERKYLDLVNTVRNLSKHFGYGDSQTP
jgi:hypothetical protein